MLLRSLPSLFRVSGSLRRCLTTCKLSVRTNNLPPYGLISIHNPLIKDPSVVNHKQIQSILDTPITESLIINEMPKIILPLEDMINKNVIEDPTKVIEQKAARLIVIRKKKMKKHKLKKLRKKMKFIWAKLRQKREMRKEKVFQAELMGQIGEAVKFNAAQYAKEKIDKANTVLLPKLWNDKMLPEFVIKDLIEKRNLRKKLREEDKERRKNMSLKVSDYKV